MSYRDDSALSTAAAASRAAKDRQESEGATATNEARSALARLRELVDAEALEEWLPPLTPERTAEIAETLRGVILPVLRKAWREYLGAEDE